MTLPLVNQFLIPSQIWSTRPATQYDVQARLSNGQHISTCSEPVPVNLIDTINTPDKSAIYLSQNQYSTLIDNCITASLNNINSGYSKARTSMPSVTPPVLSEYQRLYTNKTNMTLVNDAIRNGGDFLADDQVLFHGGGILSNINQNCSLIINRPLSTSFSPVKALNNGAWRGKYYKEGEANLIILTVKSINKKAFIFRINGTDKGHEKEVLIESNAIITVISRTLVKNDYNVYDYDRSSSQTLTKQVPFYITHATIS